MLKSCDLDKGRFKVSQGQRSQCQSIAHGRLPIRLPLTPSSYLSSFLDDVKRISQRIRGFTTMRYINLRFTYLLTFPQEQW